MSLSFSIIRLHDQRDELADRKGTVFPLHKTVNGWRNQRMLVIINRIAVEAYISALLCLLQMLCFQLSWREGCRVPPVGSPPFTQISPAHSTNAHFSRSVLIQRRLWLASLLFGFRKWFRRTKLLCRIRHDHHENGFTYVRGSRDLTMAKRRVLAEKLIFSVVMW